MSRRLSISSVIIWAVFLLLVSFFVPPFNIFWIPVVMLFERSPERVVVKSGQAITQAICDYQNEHGLLPETLDELAPAYISKPKDGRWAWQWDFESGRLIGRADQPHSYVNYWFLGPESGEWRWHGDSAYADRRVNVPPPVPRSLVLDGEALLKAKIAEYEHRIARHPEDVTYYADKLNFLGAAGLPDLLRKECERDAQVFPSWWLPRAALAKLDGVSPATSQRLEEWARNHPTFHNYWFLAHHYRQQTNAAAALQALRQALKARAEKEPKDFPLEAAPLLFDACEYAYQQGEYELSYNLARYWEAAGTQQKDWLAFQAAAGIKLGRFDEAIKAASRIVSINKHYETDAKNVQPLLTAAEAHDTGFIYHASEEPLQFEVFGEPRS